MARRPANRPTAATYALRRAGAVLIIAAIVGIVVWLTSASGSGAPPRAAATKSSTSARHASAHHAAHRAVSTRLPLAGIVAGQWTALPEAPTPRGEVSAARIGDTVYVVGGFDAAGHTSSVVQRLNLRSSTGLPSPRCRRRSTT